MKKFTNELGKSIEKTSNIRSKTTTPWSIKKAGWYSQKKARTPTLAGFFCCHDVNNEMCDVL